MSKSHRVIANPAAGAEQDHDQLRKVVDDCLACEIDFTEEAGDAHRFAEQAVKDRVDHVMVVGGDGTLFEVINGLRAASEGLTASDRPAVTLLPAGTGNDFARNFDLDHNPDTALERMNSGRIQTVDLIRVEAEGCEPRWIINVANGGFGRQVADDVTSDVKQTWGAFAYLKVASGKLADSPVFDAQLAFDDENPQAVQCSAVLICNGRFVGGGRELLLADDAEPSDRRFHVMTVTANTFYDRLATATKLLTRSHLDDPAVHVREARKLTLTADPAMGFTLDGEPCCQTPLTFTLEPAALRLTVPS